MNFKANDKNLNNQKANENMTSSSFGQSDEELMMNDPFLVDLTKPNCIKSNFAKSNKDIMSNKIDSTKKNKCALLGIGIGRSHNVNSDNIKIETNENVEKVFNPKDVKLTGLNYILNSKQYKMNKQPQLNTNKKYNTYLYFLLVLS